MYLRICIVYVKTVLTTHTVDKFKKKKTFFWVSL